MTAIRPPTMEDVAARAGVSRALVSLVMRGSPKVSDRRRDAVMLAARELGYRPNAVARSLAERRSHTFGVVVNDLHNPWFADVVDGIHQQAAEHGFSLLLNAAWRTELDEERAIESFLEHRVDAVILLGSRVSHDVLIAAADSVPLVVVGSVADGIDSVTNDDERGSELAVEHLVGLGHTAVAHIDGGDGGGARSRRRGFVAAMLARGLRPTVIGGDFTDASGARAAGEMLQRADRPTAVFAANDLVALGAIDRLEEAGLRIPADVSVVGYDNTSLAGLSHVGLTTVGQPMGEMGRVAVRCALDRLDRTRLDQTRQRAMTYLLEPELVVRSTTGPPPTSKDR